ncbi:MAG: hypothetical protein LCH41_01530 [Armatimonadetes bacterium]|nr:hypothetical protein [Armatimonadota bacterium]
MSHLRSLKQRCRRAGVTTAEFVVSAGVMLGLTVLTFDVMIAGAQVSKTSANESDQTQEARMATDEMMKEASDGAAILSSLHVPLFGTIHSSDQTVIISSPAYDTSGKRIADTDDITVYQVLEVNDKKCLYKFPARRRFGVIISISSRKLVKEDLDDIKFRFGRMATLTYDPVSRSFPLPGRDMENPNPPGSISIQKLRAPWASLSLDTREKIEDSGRVTLERNVLEMRGFIPSTATIDVFFYVNPKLTKPSSSEMDANMLEIKMRTKKQNERGRDDDDDAGDDDNENGRTITTSTVLRNAR